MLVEIVNFRGLEKWFMLIENFGSYLVIKHETEVYFAFALVF